MIDWRHQYDEARDAIERKATDAINTEPSMTQQHHAEDADINVLVRRFGITDGAIPPAVIDPAYYGDFTDAADFRTQLDRIHQAKEHFMELPADLRSRFNNDPTELFAWVSNKDNADRAIELGLLAKAPDATATPTVQPAPAPTPTPPTTA